MRLRIVLAGVLVALLGGRALAVDYVPLYKFSFLGGQYFYVNDRSNLSGNVKAHVAPVMKFSDELSVLPIYRGNYRGTKAVTDAVGSGTLFQQAMDHRVSAALHYAPFGTGWTLKPSVNYKYEFLKETRDEDWGKGLFDYQTIGFGFEAEKVYKKPFSYRLGYDFYYVKFPNFQSLESQAGVDLEGNPLNRERSGTDVLDTFNHQASFTIGFPLPYHDPRVSAQLTYRMLWQTFPDQPIINRQGQPTETKPYNRTDFNNTAALSFAYPRAIAGGRVRLLSSFGTAATYNGSNQNTFDAGQTQYFADTYSYWSVSAGPSFQVAWGDKDNPVRVNVGLRYSHQIYRGRLAQTRAGAFKTDRQYQDRYYASVGYSYPIAAHFRLNAQVSLLRAQSNQEYETTYRYTYTTGNYLMGFTYDY